MRFAKELGKAKWSSWISHQCDFSWQLLFTFFNFPNLTVDHCHGAKASGWAKVWQQGVEFCRSRMNCVYMCRNLQRSSWNNTYSLNQSNGKISKANINDLKAREFTWCVVKGSVPRKLCSLHREKTRLLSGTGSPLLTTFIYLIHFSWILESPLYKSGRGSTFTKVSECKHTCISRQQSHNFIFYT